MSSVTLRDKVAAYLAANWTETVIAGLENEIDSPPDDLAPWLSYSFHSFGETPTSIGSVPQQCLRDTGFVYFNVWVASGRGGDAALDYAEAVRSMFRHLNLGDGVRFTTVSPPEVGIPSQAQASSGNYYSYQVNASYIYDYKA